MVAVARTGCIDRLPDLRCKSVEQLRSLPGRGWFLSRQRPGFASICQALPTQVQEERIDVARIQEQIHQGWNGRRKISRRCVEPIALDL